MRKLMICCLLLTAITAHTQTFTLTSSDLGGQATSKQVFSGFGCTGQNISPQLSWSNAPTGTKSFAVTIFDQDAPTGSGWWHWLIFNIPASTSELLSGAGNPTQNVAPPNAIQSKTDFGTPGYGGPCPPPGSQPHRYVITVYALNIEKLQLDANVTPAIVGFTINQHTIQKASLIFYYKQ